MSRCHHEFDFATRSEVRFVHTLWRGVLTSITQHPFSKKIRLEGLRVIFRSCHVKFDMCAVMRIRSGEAGVTAVPGPFYMIHWFHISSCCDIFVVESEFEKHKVYMLGTRRFLFSIEKDRTVSTTSQASDVG